MDVARSDAGFVLRLDGTVSDDGARINAAWSKSHDGKQTWQHDFDVA